MSTVAIVGAGRLGTALGRLAVAAGHTVRIAGSAAPEDIALVLEFTVPGAKAESVATVADGADLVVLAAPITARVELPETSIRDRVIIDAMNYWPQTDGHIPEMGDAEQTTSELVARRFPTARVVKALNHIAYQDLEPDAFAVPQRRAAAVASADAAAAADASAFVHSLGYDPVAVGSLHRTRSMQPGGALFDRWLTADEALELLR